MTMDIDPKTVAILKMLLMLRRAGATQRAVGKVLGVSHQTVGRWLKVADMAQEAGAVHVDQELPAKAAKEAEGVNALVQDGPCKSGAAPGRVTAMCVEPPSERRALRAL
jgi:hypothetical protein